MNKEKWVTDDMQPGPHAWAVAFTFVTIVGLIGWGKFIFHDVLGWI